MLCFATVISGGQTDSQSDLSKTLAMRMVGGWRLLDDAKAKGLSRTLVKQYFEPKISAC